jgi:hypothetical protein
LLWTGVLLDWREERSANRFFPWYLLRKI